MNAQSKALPEDAILSNSRVGLSFIQQLYWSIRRELWEHPSIYIAPTVAAIVVMIGSLVNTSYLPERLRELSVLGQSQQEEATLAMLVKPYSAAGLLIIMTMFIVGLYYCIDALYSERSNHRILFWKSLPVSNATTILSKICIPLVVLPLVTIAVIFVSQILTLLVSVIILAVHGINVRLFWAQVPLSQIFLSRLSGLTLHALWYAPIYSWLLLVSSWARRAPFLWSVLPLLAVSVLEKIAFNTWHIAFMLKYRLTESFLQAFALKIHDSGILIDWVPRIDILKFLSDPELWLGLVVAAIFLTAATYQRRYRE